MRRYLVTGVSRGIGRAVAQRLLDAGHEVIGVGRHERDRPDALAATWRLDLSAPAGFADALRAELAALPRLDGLVHCAGVVHPGALSDRAVEAFTEQFTVNVTAVAELTRLLLPALRAAGGTVVLVNSGSGLNARPPLASYGASKHALRGYADALRLEEPGIRVSTVYPGRTATDMQQTVQAAEGGEYRASDYLRPETVAEVICTALTLPADGVITDLSLRPR